METRFTILLIEIGIALAIQVGALIGIMLAVRKSTAKMTAAAEEIQKRALPTLDNVQKLMEFTRPRVETAVENLTQASAGIREQVQKLDSTVSDIVDRARVQAIRADELVSRTLDRVENTTEVVTHTVISPVRSIAGIVSAVGTGLGVFFRRSHAHGNGTQNEEMFI
ncbi:MAG TPA: hypothetical protein VKW78_20775 [Terriglobales bacterium]|nr:hypothetical protein [Terriglobales bacterium]